MRNYLLMGTSGCHLCDQAAEIIVATMNPQIHQVEEVDIAFEDGLMNKYAIRIPVLVDEQSGAELGWPFDQHQLQEFISKETVSK